MVSSYDDASFYRQLGTTKLNRLMEYTISRLDEIIREREGSTSELESDSSLPPHSYSLQWEQCTRLMSADEVDLLRNMVNTTDYWATEASALFTALIEHVWASRKARQPTYWKEVTASLYRMADVFGMKPKKIREIRMQITDEEYWRHEVEILEPHRARKRYEADLEHSARVRAEMKARAENAQTEKGPAGMQQKSSQTSVIGARGARGARRPRGSRVTKPFTDTRPPTLRRSARLEKARTTAERDQRARRIGN